MYPPGNMPYNQQQMYYNQQMQYNPQQGFMGYQQQPPNQGNNFFNNFIMHNLQNSGNSQNRNNGY